MSTVSVGRGHGGRWFRRAILAAVAALATALPAQANPLIGFSGNTQPSHPSVGGVEGTVNFAVYDRTTGGAAGDLFGTGLAGFDALFVAGATGSPAFDTTARFLYLYQTVNNTTDASPVPISSNTVGVKPPLVTSWGSFAGTSFSVNVLGAPAGFTDPSPASTGAVPVVVGGQTSVITPTVTLGASSLIAAYTSPQLAAGNKSRLWGYTSNVGPVWATTGLIDGGTSADGTVPAPIPEPSTLLLSLLGLPLTVVALRRRSARS